MIESIVQLYQTPEIADALRKTMPELDIEQTDSLLSSLTLSELMGQILMMNAFLAILLSIPTTIVATRRTQ